MFPDVLSVLLFGMGQAPPLVQTLGSSVDYECGDSALEEMMAGVPFGRLISYLYQFCCTGEKEKKKVSF